MIRAASSPPVASARTLRTVLLLLCTVIGSVVGLSASPAAAADFTFSQIVSCSTPLTSVAGWTGVPTDSMETAPPFNLNTSQSGYLDGSVQRVTISATAGSWYAYGAYYPTAPYEFDQMEYGGGSTGTFDLTLTDAAAVQFALLDADIETGSIVGYLGGVEVQPIMIPGSGPGSILVSYAGNVGNWVNGGNGAISDLDERAVLQVGFTTPVDRIRLTTTQAGGSVEITNLAACQSADVVKAATAPTIVSATATSVTYTTTITSTLKNTSDATGLRVYNPSMIDDLSSALAGTPSPTQIVVSNLTSTPTGPQSAGACTVDGAFDGTTVTSLLATTAADYLEPQSSCTVTFDIAVTYPRTAGFTRNNSIAADVAGTNALASDTSTDGITAPATAKADTASPTPLVFPAANAEIRLTKSADPTVVSTVGETVTYSFLVENVGSLDVSNLAVADTLTAPAGPEITVTCPVTSLAAGASTTCTASYRTTQADLDSERIDNTAVASATDPLSLLSISSNTSSASVTTVAAPAIALVKKADTAGPVTVGQRIAYSFDVSNTGNVALEQVAVTDPMVGTVTCPQTTLAAGQTMTCTAGAAYVVRSDDVTRANLVNRASVSGRYCPTAGCQTVSDDDDLTLPTTATAVLAFTGSSLSLGLAQLGLGLLLAGVLFRRRAARTL